MAAETGTTSHGFGEKLFPLGLSCDPCSPPNPRPDRPAHPQPHIFIPSRPPRLNAGSHRSARYVRPRSLRIWNLLKKWSPVLAYGATSLGFLLAITFWKTEVFDGKSPSLPPPRSVTKLAPPLLVRRPHWSREYFAGAFHVHTYPTLIMDTDLLLPLSSHDTHPTDTTRKIRRPRSALTLAAER